MQEIKISEQIINHKQLKDLCDTQEMPVIQKSGINNKQIVLTKTVTVVPLNQIIAATIAVMAWIAFLAFIIYAAL